MLRLRDIMTRELVTFAPDLSLREAADALLERHLSAAPVVAGGRLLGVISTPDILGFVASAPPPPAPERDDEDDWAADVEGAPEPDEMEEDEPSGRWFAELSSATDDELVERFGESPGPPPHDLLAQHTVADAMTHGARSLPPDAGVDEAADLMRREGIHRVLVVEDEKLLGLVSALDIARAVADHQLLVRRFVFDRNR